MTQEELAALSEAATQSEPAWNVFAQALVSAYRAGQLVLIGPDAVEVVARAACSHNGLNPDEIFEGHPLWTQYEDEQRAALAALGVK